MQKVFVHFFLSVYEYVFFFTLNTNTESERFPRLSVRFMHNSSVTMRGGCPKLQVFPFCFPRKLMLTNSKQNQKYTTVKKLHRCLTLLKDYIIFVLNLYFCITAKATLYINDIVRRNGN